LVPHKTFYDGSERPDLYGPFWIATSLVILMAATGNFATYLTNSDTITDYRKLSLAASLFYFCITVQPVVMWFIGNRLAMQRSLVETISLFGYALFVYVPASVLFFVIIHSIYTLIPIHHYCSAL
jgi:hypothetical protein